MKSVIIGAGGFVGRHLGHHLQERGDAVAGLDVTRRDDVGFPLDPCDVVTGEIVVPPGTDTVFYLAQSPHYRSFPERADRLFGVNVLGALRALEAARRVGAGLFCFASTGTVYAPSFAPVAETHPVRRDDGYALSKLCAEEALVLAAGPVRLLRVRLFGVLGPGQSGMLVQNLAERIRAGRPVVVAPSPHDPEDDEGLRLSMTYVDDLVQWLGDLAALATGGGAVDPLLNVAGDEVASIRGLAGRIGRELGVAPRFERAPDSRDSDHVADIGRLRALVAPRFTPLDEAVARTLTVHV